MCAIVSFADASNRTTAPTFASDTTTSFTATVSWLPSTTDTSPLVESNVATPSTFLLGTSAAECPAVSTNALYVHHTARVPWFSPRSASSSPPVQLEPASVYESGQHAR